MRYELTDYEWAAVRPFLPNKPRGVPRVNYRRLKDSLPERLGEPPRPAPHPAPRPNQSQRTTG